MSPVAVLALEDTVTSGGRRSGRERKLWKSIGAGVDVALAPALELEPLAGRSGNATLKPHANGMLCPPLTRLACTLTCSPGANGLVGTKLAPSPWE